MNARDEWPTAGEVAEWWAQRAMEPPTPEQLEAMAEEYAREQMADAQSAADHAANQKRYAK